MSGPKLPVTITGYMGSGKSTVGRLLAERLGRPFVDLDDEIEARTGRTIAEIFVRHGEPYFRDLEYAALAAALDDGRAAGAIIACGGGIVTHPASRELLATVATVFMKEDLTVLYERTRAAGRPLRGISYEEFVERYEGRLPIYHAAADLTVDVGGRSQNEVAEEIIRWLNG